MAALGADEKPHAEISLYAVHLVHQSELVEPQFLGGELECSEAARVDEAL